MTSVSLLAKILYTLVTRHQSVAPVKKFVKTGTMFLIQGGILLPRFLGRQNFEESCLYLLS